MTYLYDGFQKTNEEKDGLALSLNEFNIALQQDRCIPNPY